MSAAIEREFEELDAQNRWQQLYLVSGRLTEPPPSPSEDRARARRRPPPPPPPVGAEVAARVRRPGPLRFGARGGVGWGEAECAQAQWAPRGGAGGWCGRVRDRAGGG